MKYFLVWYIICEFLVLVPCVSKEMVAALILSGIFGFSEARRKMTFNTNNCCWEC